MTKFKLNKTSENKGIQTIFGLHSVKAAIENNKRELVELIINKNHINLAKKFEFKIKKITILPQKEFTKKFGNEYSTQGIVLKTKEFTRLSLEKFIQKEKNKLKSVILVLDQVTDPQNIGSIMRSCALFNCLGIIVGKDNSPELTPSLYKAASGAGEIVNYFRVTNIRRTLSLLKKNNYWIYGFDNSSNQKSNLTFSNKSVLVFGSEGKGMRDLIKKECDEIMQISIEKNLKFEIDSLNVSNASSIALYKFYSE
tara:strand:+ start:99 stop:860 length:762 start_codon:yes stop_codon:yes gene_type:complete